jgi:RimJ/RimL family protein N-acetyltransferase
MECRFEQDRILLPRLILRPFVLEDLEDVNNYSSDIDVTKHLHWGPYSEKETKNFINMAISEAGQKGRTRYRFALTLKDENRAIGSLAVRVVSTDDREASIGFVVGKGYWGMGYGSEAVYGLLFFGFDVLKMHRISASCTSENIGSIKVLEKVGMTREGVLRHNRFVKGAWRDSVIYSMLEDEWLEGETSTNEWRRI